MDLGTGAQAVEVMASGCAAAPAGEEGGRVRTPQARFVEDSGVQPWTIEELARQLPQEAYRRINWREGGRGTQSSNFAAVRIQVAEGHDLRKAPGTPECLLCEWPPEFL